MSKHYDEVFKRDAVTLRGWRDRLAKAAAGKPAPQSLEAAQMEVRQLRQEVADLRRQREIFKKTLGILAEPPSNDASASKP